MPNGKEQTLDVLSTVLSVILITLLPVGIGMFIRSVNERFARRMGKPVKILSAVFLGMIIIAAMLKERENLSVFFRLAGPAALVLNVAMLTIGFYVARLFRLLPRQSGTISIETGIQNGTLGITIAATLLNNAEMTIPSAIYSLIMFITAGAVIYIGHRTIRD